MEQTDIVDEIDTAAFPALTKEEKTTSSSLVKEKAFLCLIYDLDFRTSGGKARIWRD